MSSLIDMVSAELAANIRGNAWDERGLQDVVEHVLDVGPWSCLRESPLGPRDRPDFLIGQQQHSGSGDALAMLWLAVECKVGGSITQLTRQIDRYLAHEIVVGVLVVTTRMALIRLPTELRGKPIRGCLINGFA